MLKKSHLLLLVLAAVAVVSTAGDNVFVRKSCTATRYPEECYASLANSTSTDALHLAIDATAVSLTNAGAVTAGIVALRKSATDPKTNAALDDCVDNLQAAEGLINDSVGELEKLVGATGIAVSQHLGNAKTYMSAVISDETTCVDSFSGDRDVDAVGGFEKVGAQVLKMVTPLEHYSSNALALINQLAH